MTRRRVNNHINDNSNGVGHCNGVSSQSAEETSPTSLQRHPYRDTIVSVRVYKYFHNQQISSLKLTVCLAFVLSVLILSTYIDWTHISYPLARSRTSIHPSIRKHHVYFEDPFGDRESFWDDELLEHVDKTEEKLRKSRGILLPLSIPFSLTTHTHTHTHRAHGGSPLCPASSNSTT
jgi:hypothetical protein